MKVREWLESKDKFKSVTFIIQKAVKDEQHFMYHEEYRTTPIHTVEQWLQGKTADNYIIVGADHPPIDPTNCGWMNWYKKGHLLCAVITTEEDVFTHYSEEQGKRMLEMYDKKAREVLANERK